MKIFYQNENTECALACIAMISNHYGLNLELTTLRSRFPISMKGTNIKNIIDILNELNLESRALKCEMTDVRFLRLPVILHWDMVHFVILMERKSNKYIIADPNFGIMKFTEKEFSEHYTGIALEVWPGPHFEKKSEKNKLKISRLIILNSDIKLKILKIFIFSLFIESSMLIVPGLQEIIIDDGLPTSDLDLITLVIIASLVFVIGSATTTAVKTLIQRNLTSSLSLIVPSNVFSHLMQLHSDWFNKRSPADVANRFDSANTIHKTLTTSTITAFIDGLVAFLALIIMFFYSKSMAGLVTVDFIIYITMRYVWFSNYRQMSAGLLAQTSRLQSFIWETLKGISTIKQFSGAEQRHRNYVTILSKFVNIQSNLSNVNTAYNFFHDLLFGLERIILLYLGVKQILSAQLSIGMFIAFMSFRENFTAKITNLTNTLVEFRALSVHLDRLSDILLTEKEYHPSLPYLGEGVIIKGKVSLKNVTYSYSNFDSNVIENCSFDIPAGKITAIVAKSGKGKSTLIKIIAGQIIPKSGSILIDDKPLTQFMHKNNKNVISLVKQDDTLFAGTILENISLLDANPNMELVINSAKTANIHEEIQSMTMAYNTMIGQLGTGLSGGQTQRIMLARALYKQPKILILDEATSHLDLINEKIINENLRKLEITQIIVAHRPETILNSDFIYNLENNELLMNEQHDRSTNQQ